MSDQENMDVDEIIENEKNLESDERRSFCPRKCKKKNITDVIELPDLPEVSNDQKESIFKPTALMANERDPSGDKVFKFNTPIKKGKMLEKALNSPSTPRTPRGIALRNQPGTPKTPKGSILKPSNGSLNSPRTPKSSVKFMPGTPKSGMKSKLLSTPSRNGTNDMDHLTQTPQPVRKSIRNRIVRIAMDSGSSSDDYSDDDDEDFSDKPSSTDDDEEEEINSTLDTTSEGEKNIPIIPIAKTPRKVKKARNLEKNVTDVAADGSEYFNSCRYGNTKITTSDHTLSHLNNPRMTTDDLHSLLTTVSNGHVEEKLDILNDHECSFSRWMMLLCEGYSLFLHGIGSKKNLVGLFRQQYLQNFDHLEINGFFPSLTLKSILSGIIEDIMEVQNYNPGIQECVELISKRYGTPNVEPLFLIIHNLDGPMLRPEKTSSVLARIAKLPSVYVIATLDHINAPLILDINKISAYNPIWWDATTFEPYTEETSYENSLLVQQSGALALSSLVHVFESLTPNAKKIFLLIAKNHLENKENTTYSGISFPELYQRCREEFLVNSDLTLRAQLIEFHDHKLIKTKRGHDGIENIVVCLNNATLEEFVSQQEQEA